jgi:hypothetical protein
MSMRTKKLQLSKAAGSSAAASASAYAAHTDEWERAIGFPFMVTEKVLQSYNRDGLLPSMG